MNFNRNQFFSYQMTNVYYNQYRHRINYGPYLSTFIVGHKFYAHTIFSFCVIKDSDRGRKNMRTNEWINERQATQKHAANICVYYIYYYAKFEQNSPKLSILQVLEIIKKSTKIPNRFFCRRMFV